MVLIYWTGSIAYAAATTKRIRRRCDARRYIGFAVETQFRFKGDTSMMGLRPNGLGISGGAPIDRYWCRAILTFKNAPILWARSAVRCMPRLDGNRCTTRVGMRREATGCDLLCCLSPTRSNRRQCERRHRTRFAAQAEPAHLMDTGSIE